MFNQSQVQTKKGATTKRHSKNNALDKKKISRKMLSLTLKVIFGT